jgi:sortase A
MSTTDDAKKMRRLECLLLAVGLVLLATSCAGLLFRHVASRVAIKQFQTGDVARLRQHADSFVVPNSASTVDFRQWSIRRTQAFWDSISQKFDTPLAVLRIPKLDLEVPVFNGTDALTLDRGVGRILGTVKPGQGGNMGIAGHRDGFFRGLKDLIVGDVVDLDGPEHSDRYIVRQIQIVKPDDVSVLAPTTKRTITLVTCFPFYYAGSAPERYIVKASIQNSKSAEQSSERLSVSTGSSNLLTKEMQNGTNQVF